MTLHCLGGIYVPSAPVCTPSAGTPYTGGGWGLSTAAPSSASPLVSGAFTTRKFSADSIALTIICPVTVVGHDLNAAAGNQKTARRNLKKKRESRAEQEPAGYKKRSQTMARTAQISNNGALSVTPLIHTIKIK